MIERIYAELSASGPRALLDEPSHIDTGGGEARFAISLGRGLPAGTNNTRSLAYCSNKQYAWGVTGPSALTTRQAAVLAFVEHRQAETGICPSHEEIAAHFRWRSTYAVREHLRLMARKGVIICSPGKFRAIKVTRLRQAGGIPILGRIPAGPLAEAVEEAGEILPVAPDYFGGGALFALRVHGESMKNAGIFDGDLAVMRHQTTVDDGEIAAVQINHEATLKRVLRTPGGLILRAENPDIADRRVTADEQSEVTIGGICVGLIRKGRARKR